jgi:hypothetical protein
MSGPTACQVRTHTLSIYVQFIQEERMFLILCCLTATEMQSVDAIKARMEQVQVVGVTCLGIYHPLLAHKKFDTCIMDEAGQITLPVSTNWK